MIPVAQLNAVADREFVSLLRGIYEHSDWIARRTSGQRPFPDLGALAKAMRQAVDQSSFDEKLGLIRAHPDLAGKLARCGTLTEESAREQAGLGLDRLSDREFGQFTRNNKSYHERFGFPFVICARVTTKQGVLDAFVKRLENSRDEEITEALSQIHQIAGLRLTDRITP